MESPLEIVRRRRDERLLKKAILAGSLSDDVARDVVDALWTRVAETPRWRRARVTPDNAQDRLQESRDGFRYTEDGRRLITDRGLRRLIQGYVRQAQASGNRAEADGLQALLDRGKSAPADWETSGAWYAARQSTMQ
ncbi:hypothetical protein [Nocardia transvalensis]|uniref:hypothetical protein n=1 Tax=Nocardia transvalensis TaxID=37333 RepID=UPI001894E79F|nr:hypothetical protein [Nocardia transvalensis]MBF6333569.1 hypothetical protein [Nocardia transvalensis]